MPLEFSFPGGGSAVLTFWVNAAMIWSREEAIKSHPTSTLPRTSPSASY